MLQQDADGRSHTPHLPHRDAVTRLRDLQLEWAQHEERDCLKISGWTDAELRELVTLDAGALSRRLAVYPSEAVPSRGGRPAVPPAAGRLLVEAEAGWFAPRFPFADGVSYSLLVESGGDADGPEVWEIQRPSPEAPPTTEVVAIYPTAAELPVNLLRGVRPFLRADERGLGGARDNGQSRGHRRNPG